jgi:penicillin-binding protein 1A
LSEVILSNGGARATPDAPAELLAAEEEARSARLGIWRHM